jgi:hypothetical protein
VLNFPASVLDGHLANINVVLYQSDGTSIGLLTERFEHDQPTEDVLIKLKT